MVLVAARTIRLRYAGTCSECKGALPVGAKAWWDAGMRTTTCPACRVEGDRARIVPDPSVRGFADAHPNRPMPLVTGAAGASASREYEKRHARRAQQIDQRWGRLAGIVKFLS